MLKMPYHLYLSSVVMNCSFHTLIAFQNCPTFVITAWPSLCPTHLKGASTKQWKVNRMAPAFTVVMRVGWIRSFGSCWALICCNASPCFPHSRLNLQQSVWQIKAMIVGVCNGIIEIIMLRQDQWLQYTQTVVSSNSSSSFLNQQQKRVDANQKMH